MDAKQTQAYEWAKNQKYTSVAADYARTLAGAIDAITADSEAWKRRAEKAEGAMRAVCHECGWTVGGPICGSNKCPVYAAMTRDEGKEESK